MCASVCPSEALWYGTVEEFDADPHAARCIRDFHFGRQDVRTKVYTVVDDLAPGPLDVLADTPAPGSTTPSTSKRPDDDRSRTGDRSTSTPSRSGGATSPTSPPARKRSPAASSPATSCSAPAPWRRATSASPRGPSCARSTPASPAPIVALDQVAGRRHLPVPRTRPTTTRPILLRTRRPRARRVQPEVHAPRLRRLLPGRRGPLALPVPRRQLRDRDRRRDLRAADRGPLGRIDVEVRDDGHDLGARRAEPSA